MFGLSALFLLVSSDPATTTNSPQVSTIGLKYELIGDDTRDYMCATTEQGIPPYDRLGDVRGKANCEAECERRPSCTGYTPNRFECFIWKGVLTREPSKLRRDRDNLGCYVRLNPVTVTTAAPVARENGGDFAWPQSDWRSEEGVCISLRLVKGEGMRIWHIINGEPCFQNIQIINYTYV